MIVLRLTEPQVKRAIRHPALNGLKRIARGSFCAVYDNGETVLKLTCDGAQYDFSCDRYRPRGAYFPRLIKNYGQVGNTKSGLALYLMEVEKLEPIDKKAPAALALAREILTPLMWVSPGAGQDLYRVVRNKNLPLDLRKAIGRVRYFTEQYDCSPDFHLANLMRRGDQIVLNDVVADMKAYRRAELMAGLGTGGR